MFATTAFAGLLASGAALAQTQTQAATTAASHGAGLSPSTISAAAILGVDLNTNNAQPAAAVSSTATATATATAAAANMQALAGQVHTGRMNCELGKHVNIVPSSQQPDLFEVSGSGFKFHMTPVLTSTGTVRLEDSKAGAIWLQIANKSMLMNQKTGQRLADECMSPQQMQVAEAIRLNPPKSLLEGIGGQ
ncbi:MAG: hypothetical protein KIG95_05340 [Comamonas sp.]|nr:hypothetical protein [Comamonas sp.]